MSNIEKLVVAVIVIALGISIYIPFFGKCESLKFLPITSLPARCIIN